MHRRGFGEPDSSQKLSSGPDRSRSTSLLSARTFPILGIGWDRLRMVILRIARYTTCLESDFGSSRGKVGKDLEES